MGFDMLYNICVIDFETSISDGPHGPAAKDPRNDFYTIIWGKHPEKIQVLHNEKGFKRDLSIAKEDVLGCDLLVGHNMPFDLSYIIKDITTIINTWDCQVAEFLLSGQRHSYASLAELQEIYLGRKIKKDKISQLFKRGIGADKIVAARHRCKRLFKLYEEYCYDDGSTTLKIFKYQYELAKKRNMLALIIMYNKFMVALTILMSQGIKVDLINTEKTRQAFRLKALEYLTQATELIAPYWNDPRLPPFKVLSPAHKSALLFGGNIMCEVNREIGHYKNGKVKTKLFKEEVYVEGFQLPLEYTTKSKVAGRYSTDAGVIHNIATKSSNKIAQEYCKLQIEAMHYEKMDSTYLTRFLNYSIDGYLYPHFNNTAVVTGRLSGSLQTIPSKGKFVNDIQGQLIAPEGYICLSNDYSQLEMWIAAWNSKDEQLVNDLINGLDFHCQSLAFARQIDYDEVYDLCHNKKDPEWCLLRTKAKAITFQKEYGAGFKKVAETTGLSVDTIQAVFEALDSKYWRLKLFKEHVLNTAQRNMRPSHIKHIPTMQRKGGENGRRFNSDGYELLPVVSGNDRRFYNTVLREVGYYQTSYGKRYAFEEYGDIGRDGGIRRGISVPQTKNYTSQGGAAEVMAAVSIELMEFCLSTNGDVKYISQIHDSAWFYVKEEKKELYIPKLCAIMEDVPHALKKHLNVDVGFKFPVEAKWGYNFAEMEVW